MTASAPSTPEDPTSGDGLRELKALCMDNLLASPEARIYFKDAQSRFLLASAGCSATLPAGRALDELIGKTDLDFYSKEHAVAAFEDEQRVIRTGEPIVGKQERETFHDRPDAWVSTSRMPLRSTDGEIIGTFGITRDITAQVKAESDLSYQVLHDPVTGLANRVALMDRLKQALAALERQPGRLAVMFVDLDYFKDVNDSFTHAVGDFVLAEVGRRLTRVSRRSDTVARLSGDEFIVLLAAPRTDEDVARVADRIVEDMRAPFITDGHELAVTCSIGFTITTDPQDEPEQLIHDADEAMYDAKGSGRNRHRHFDSSKHAGSAAARLTVELNHAIEHKDLFLLYQPLFSLDDQTLVGVEALVRWNHPERGIVPPDEFIPFAEKHGLISKIDAFVLDTACRQLAEWTSVANWPTGFTMAVNVSGRELSEPGFAKQVASTIATHALSPEQICLEITETAFVGAWGDIQGTLEELSALGVRIALDDFGTGYSSLAHLQRMKVDVLKIDRSFVEQIGHSDRDREIVAAVTSMSHALGILVVGEGVETGHQLSTLTGLACDQGQGFLLARPMSAEDVTALVPNTALAVN